MPAYRTIAVFSIAARTIRILRDVEGRFWLTTGDESPVRAELVCHSRTVAAFFAGATGTLALEGHKCLVQLSYLHDKLHATLLHNGSSFGASVTEPPLIAALQAVLAIEPYESQLLLAGDDGFLLFTMSPDGRRVASGRITDAAMTRLMPVRTSAPQVLFNELNGCCSVVALQGKALLMVTAPECKDVAGWLGAMRKNVRAPGE